MTATTPSTSVRNATEQRALALLGSGCGPEVVASALGVSASRISQLLSEESFAIEVANLRFQNLQKHNEIDSTYDALEKKLLGQLEDVLPLMMRPNDILRAVSVINGAKRRGQSAPEQITHQNQVVNLTMPIKIVQQFTTNIQNQVVQAGSQTLETIQAGALLARTAHAATTKTQLLENSSGTSNRTAVESTRAGSASSS